MCVFHFIKDWTRRIQYEVFSIFLIFQVFLFWITVPGLQNVHLEKIWHAEIINVFALGHIITQISLVMIVSLFISLDIYFNSDLKSGKTGMFVKMFYIFLSWLKSKNSYPGSARLFIDIVKNPKLFQLALFSLRVWHVLKTVQSLRGLIYNWLYLLNDRKGTSTTGFVSLDTVVYRFDWK